MQAKGFGFIDFSSEDFDAHFEIDGNFYFVPKTNRARYSLIMLRLNRPNLVKIRRMVYEIGCGKPPEVKNYGD